MIIKTLGLLALFVPALMVGWEAFKEWCYEQTSDTD